MKQALNWMLNHLNEVIIAIAAFFAGALGSYMYWIFIMVCLDFLTGMWAAKKRGEKIKSRGWRTTAKKVAGYCIAVYACNVVERPIFLGSMIPLAKCIATFIVITEFKSIGENVSCITGIDISSLIKGIFKNRDVIKEIASSNDTDTSETEKDVPNEPKID